MPDAHALLLFLLAGWLLNLTPGPDVLCIVRHALRDGVRAGMLAGLGVVSGCFVHIGAAALGVGLLLQGRRDLGMGDREPARDFRHAGRHQAVGGLAQPLATTADKPLAQRDGALAGQGRQGDGRHGGLSVGAPLVAAGMG